MSTSVAAVGAQFALLLTPSLTTEIYVVGLAAFLALIPVLLTAVTLLFVVGFLSHRQRVKGVTVTIGDQDITINELALLPLFSSIGLVVIAAFQQFFGSVTSTAGSLLSVVAMNPRKIISLVLLSGFIAVYLAQPQLIFPTMSSAYNCFVGPLMKSIVMPPAVLSAFSVSNVLPVTNFISRVSKTATTSAVLRAVVGASQQVFITSMLLGAAVLELGKSQVAWVQQTTPPGQVARLLVVGPDFNQSSHLIGDAIYNLRNVTNQACSPLQPYVFEPLLKPFDDEEFATALNATLAFTYVATTQNIFKAAAEYIVNLSNNPGGTFGELAPVPSFNSTIDTANTAIRSWARFLDAFIPNIVDGLNTLLRDATGLPLPSIAFPRRGPFTLLGAIPDLILRLAKLTQNLVFQIVFNPDVAFSYPDGLNIWKLDLFYDGLREYASILSDYTSFIADYMEALGQEFEDELTTPLSAVSGHRSLSVAVFSPTGGRQFVVMSTQGEVVNEALTFVANIVKQIPCVITAVLDAILEVVSLLQDFAIGTIYKFVNSAFAGEVASPFDYAHTLFRTDAVYDVACKVNGTIVFRAPKLNPCPDLLDAQSVCRSPKRNASTLVYYFSPPLYSSWQPADQLTLSAAFCQFGCPGQLVENSNIAVNITTPPFVNRFERAFEKILEPVVCLFKFLSALCVGNTCPFDTFTAERYKLVLKDIATLLVNPFLHVDLIATSSYLVNGQCYPVQDLPTQLQELSFRTSNLVRHFVNAFLDEANAPECPDSGFTTVQPSAQWICCLLNLYDSIVGFFASLAKMLIIQLQSVLINFLPSGSGGLGVTSYVVPPFTFDETWLQVTADSLGCLPTQLIPSDLMCSASFSVTVKSTAASTLSVIAFEAITFVPRLIVSTVNGLLALLLNPSLFGFNTFLTGLLNPLVQAFGNIMLALATMLACVDVTNVLSTTFQAIATFITGALNTVLPVIISFGTAVFQAVIGVFALLTGDATIFFLAIANFASVIAANINVVVNAFAGIIISLLGQSFVCSATEALCFATEFVPTPAIQNSTFVQACNQGLGTSDPSNPVNQFHFVFCDDNRKRSTDMSLCFDFIAKYGYERAATLTRGEHQDDQDRRAAACYEYVNSPGALMRHVLMQQKAQSMFLNVITQAPQMIREHWEKQAAAASETVEALCASQRAYTQSLVQTHPVQDPIPSIDFSLFISALMNKLNGDDRDAVAFTKMVTGHHESQQRVKRSLTQFPQHSSAMINFAAAVKHIQNAHFPSLKFEKTAAVMKPPKKLEGMRDQSHHVLKLGSAVLSNIISTGVNRAAGRLNAIIRTALDKSTTIDALPDQSESVAVQAARRIDAGEVTYRFTYLESRGYSSLTQWVESGDMVAPLAITVDPDFLPVLGLPSCNSSEQIICTDCKYVDDIILVSEKSFNAARGFYTAPGNETGTFNELSDRLNTYLNRLLVDPLGNDTYTTEPRTVPFITTRIWNIRWPWQYDFTEFLSILNEAQVACDNTDPLASLDIDQNFKDAFTKLFGNLIPLAQQAICRVTLAPAETATRLVERYVMCDYDEALYGIGNKGVDSPDGPQRLLNGFAASLLLVAVFVLAIEAIPGMSSMFIMMVPLILWYGTFWIGYGSSIGCSTPALHQPFGAYPVSLPMDAYGLLESVFAPSTPYPVGLIDPAAREQYAEVLITTCGAPPPVIDCAEAAGFTSIYDNIFFTTGVLFGDSFNEGVASSLGAISPSIQQSALKFTEAHIAELDADHNIGDVCNRLTFGAVLFGFLGILFAVAGGLASISFVIPFMVAIIVFTYLVLLVVNEVLSQVDRHYVDPESGRNQN